jgi:TPR repeat protein
MTMTVRTDAFQSATAILSGEDMYRLGLEASLGSDGEFDLITAHKWFNLAAMMGNIEARTYRAELAREMTPDEVAEAQRLAREYLSSHSPRMAG